MSGPSVHATADRLREAMCNVSYAQRKLNEAQETLTACREAHRVATREANRAFRDDKETT